MPLQLDLSQSKRTLWSRFVTRLRTAALLYFEAKTLYYKERHFRRNNLKLASREKKAEDNKRQYFYPRQQNTEAMKFLLASKSSRKGKSL